MDPASVRATLTKVLETIQRDSGFSAVSITGSTCPAGDLEGFDSKIWPLAISQVATALGVSIPPQRNIFLASDGKRRLSVDEIVSGLCGLASSAA